MLLGFIYVIRRGNSYDYREINMRAGMTAYMNQVKAVNKSEKDIVVRWKFQTRNKKSPA